VTLYAWLVKQAGVKREPTTSERPCVGPARGPSWLNVARQCVRPPDRCPRPTNTGKTYLAIERMLGHESGMIGFPLRLLARENYDRIVKIKGAIRWH
jgi:hypothetical protein